MLNWPNTHQFSGTVVWIIKNLWILSNGYKCDCSTSFKSQSPSYNRLLICPLEWYILFLLEGIDGFMMVEWDSRHYKPYQSYKQSMRFAFILLVSKSRWETQQHKYKPWLHPHIRLVAGWADVSCERHNLTRTTRPSDPANLLKNTRFCSESHTCPCFPTADLQPFLSCWTSFQGRQCWDDDNWSGGTPAEKSLWLVLAPKTSWYGPLLCVHLGLIRWMK